MLNNRFNIMSHIKNVYTYTRYENIIKINRLYRCMFLNDFRLEQNIKKELLGCCSLHKLVLAKQLLSFI